MNRHLETAFELASQIDAILYAIDQTFLEDAESRQQYLHHTAQDLIQKLMSELELLSQDRKVVDAIYAVNYARRCTSKTKD